MADGFVLGGSYLHNGFGVSACAGANVEQPERPAAFRQLSDQARNASRRVLIQVSKLAVVFRHCREVFRHL